MSTASVTNPLFVDVIDKLLRHVVLVVYQLKKKVCPHNYEEAAHILELNLMVYVNLKKGGGDSRGVGVRVC